MRVSQKGFTLIELLVVITIIGILAAIALPNYIKAKDKAKEVEAKANLHTIQIAVERYNTDNKEYPPFLLGGDSDGWLYWHATNNEPDPPPTLANAWVQDPLVEYDYIMSYPENPFVDAGDGNLIIESTNCGIDTDPQQGDGDPRFGYKGNIMGNGLDDPNFFRYAANNLPYSRVETKRTLDRGGKCDPTGYGFPSWTSTDYKTYPGLYYNFGGRFNWENGSTIYTFWPGNFFYRSSTDIQPMRKGWGWPYPNTNYQGHVLRYMLGVWGSQSNPGYDLIRLQTVTPVKETDSPEPIYWRFPPPFQLNDPRTICGYTGRANEPIGLPAVFGGGDALTGPYWPSDRDPQSLGNFIYGAPDGVKDGIIHYLTTGEEKSSIVK
jgi:type II secretion system protein G